MRQRNDLKILLTLLLAAQLAACQKEVVVPEEWLRVGSFEIGRWKIHFQSGENNARPDDYYWNSIVRFQGKPIDFCTPAGWGGESLCSEKSRRGRFAHAYVVSDAPPAILLQYGGSSGNSDGELWLFTEKDQQIERRRIAINYSNRLQERNDGRFGRDDDWDLRKQAFVVVDDDVWLETSPFRHLELSHPVGTNYLRLASRSPDGQRIARIGYSDLLGTENRLLILVLSTLSNPLVPEVYVLEGPAAGKADARDEIAGRFADYFEWNTENNGLRASKPAQLNSRLVNAVIASDSLKDVPPDKRFHNQTRFVPSADTTHLPAFCEAIFAGVPDASRSIDLSPAERSIEMQGWGTIHLRATERGIEISEPSSNHSAHGDASMNYVAWVLQKALYRGEISLTNPKNRAIRPACQRAG